MTKFIQCFPTEDGKVACQHSNGNWIVFPIYGRKEREDKDKAESYDPAKSEKEVD